MRHPSQGPSARKLVVLGALIAMLLHACHLDERVGPAPGLSASHAVLGTFSAPTPPHNEQGISWGPTGIMIPDGVEVRVTMTGFSQFSPNPNRAACSSTPPVSPPLGLTSIGPSGYPRDVPGYAYTGGGIGVALGPELSGGGELISDGPWDGEVYVVGIRGPGELWVSRTASFPGSCAIVDDDVYEPDYLVSGSQTLVVEAVEAVAIEVVCSGSGAARGSTVSCEARPQPSTEALAVTAWSFVSTANETVTRETDVNSLTWAGQLAVDGRIAVTGTVAGHPAQRSTAVSVTPRDWSNKTVRSNHTTPGADGLPIRPTAMEGQLGLSDLEMRVREDLNNYAAFISDEGPNNRFWFMTDIPFETFTVARVNYPAMTEGSDWYRIQYPRDTRRGSISYCGQGRVLTLPPLVEAHRSS